MKNEIKIRRDSGLRVQFQSRVSEFSEWNTGTEVCEVLS